jgi:hypothetical protein
MMKGRNGLRMDHRIRHSHNLGTVPAPHPGTQTGHPVINQPSRRYAEALDACRWQRAPKSSRGTNMRTIYVICGQLTSMVA